jgi:hypothetical protein
MTEHNIFDEAKEDLERQRLEALWKQYGIWVIVLAIGLVLATASATSYRSWKAGHNQQLTKQYLAATKTDTDTAKSIDQLQKFADQNAGTNQAAFALLHAGALAIDRNDKAEAAVFFDKVAADTKADPAFRQLGDLLSVEAQMDSGDSAALMQRLEPLTDVQGAWHFSALQDQGFLALRANDIAKARQIFTDLSQDARAPQSISAKATDILRSLN